MPKQPDIVDHLEFLADEPGTCWVSMIEHVLRRAAREIRKLRGEPCKVSRSKKAGRRTSTDIVATATPTRETIQGTTSGTPDGRMPDVKTPVIVASELARIAAQGIEP